MAILPDEEQYDGQPWIAQILSGPTDGNLHLKFSGSGVCIQDLGVLISDINLLTSPWTQLYPKWNSLLVSDLQSHLCQC